MVETTFRYLLTDSFLIISREGEQSIDGLVKELEQKRSVITKSKDDQEDWHPQVRELGDYCIFKLNNKAKAPKRSLVTT